MTSEEREPGGAMIFELDSIAQRELGIVGDSPDDTPPPLPDQVIGLVRAAVLYGAEVVLTAAQVFDGTLLLAIGPDALIESVGGIHRTDAVVVAISGSTATETLERMRARADFIWESKPAETGDPSADADAMARWARRQDSWATAIDQHRFLRRRWRPFPFVARLAARLSDPPVAGDLAARLGGADSRSAAHGILDDPRLDRDESARLRRWWDAAYADTVAEHQRARWITVAAPETARAATSAPGTGERAGGAVGSIPQVVIATLGGLTGASFGQLRSDAEPMTRKFAERPRLIDRFRIGLLVLEAARSRLPVTDLVLLVVRLLAFGVLILVTFGDIGVHLPRWLVVVLAIAGLAVQVPFSDLAGFVRLFGRGSRAVIRAPMGVLHDR